MLLRVKKGEAYPSGNRTEHALTGQKAEKYPSGHKAAHVFPGGKAEYDENKIRINISETKVKHLKHSPLVYYRHKR